MAFKQPKVLWMAVVIATSLGTAFLVLGKPIFFNRTLLTRAADPIFRVSSQTAKPRHRNLSLQPEASKMSRRLGQRFLAGKREKSILHGVLTIGSEQRVVQTTRTQTDDGEEIEITAAASSQSLTWRRAQGTRSSNGQATKSERELVERLVFDSADQFVLAQLRGASYFAMGRNVRPENAGDNYSGPLWNIVRVSDPEMYEGKRPLSKWRLYFINTATGLIDRIESELDGERIVAELSGWTDIDGERLPTEITWTKQGQQVMHYRLANFSHFAE